MVSHEHRFVVIHINEAGGTRIARALGGRSDPPKPGLARKKTKSIQKIMGIRYALGRVHRARGGSFDYYT